MANPNRDVPPRRFGTAAISKGILVTASLFTYLQGIWFTKRHSFGSVNGPIHTLKQGEALSPNGTSEAKERQHVFLDVGANTGVKGQHGTSEPSVGTATFSSGISRDALEMGPKTHPRPRLDGGHLKRFIIIPEHKLVFCYIEKTGCSMFNHLFRMVRLYHPSMANNMQEAEFQAQSSWGRNDLDHNNITIDRKGQSKLEDLLIDPEWTKATFYRDPVTRFLSAFRSKCGGKDPDGGRHCGQAFGLNMTGDVQGFRQAIQDMSKDPTQAFRNHHFAPTSHFCGGLEHTLDYYDFVHELTQETAPQHVKRLLLKVGVDPNVTQTLVDNVVRTGATNLEQDAKAIKELLGIELKGSTTTKAGHNTGSSGSRVLNEYLHDKELVQQLRDIYRKDYELFQIK